MSDQTSQQGSSANAEQGGANNETELKDLKERIARTEIGIVALSDDRFDADVYRKAMELVVKEQLFGRIMTILAVAGLILGAGYALLATQFLRGVAEEAVEQRAEQLDELTTRAESAFLKSLLKDYLEGDFDSEAGREILSSDNNRRILTTLLTEPEDRTSLRLAAQFVLYTGDTELNDLLRVTAANSDTTPAIRAEAIRVLAEFNSDGTIKLLLAALEETSTGSYDADLLKILSYETEAPARAADIMRGVLDGDQDESVEAALRFFLVNRSLECDAACESSIKKHANRFPTLVSLFQDVRAADQGTELDADRISKIYQSVIALEGRSDPEAMAPIYEVLSILLLEAGDMNLYRHAYANDFRYRHEVWVDQVASRFEEFAQTSNLGDLYSITDPSRQRSAQELLWETTQGYSFDPASGLYVWVGNYIFSRQEQRDSVQMLRNGDFDGFLMIMSTDYYEPTLWVEDVRPLFPDFDFNGEPGSFSVQDELWGWVEENLDRLEWQDDAFRLQT